MDLDGFNARLGAMRAPDILRVWITRVCRVLFFAWMGSAAVGWAGGVEHVLLIGVDGLSPEGVRRAETPHLDRLRQTGAWTFKARAVMPTSSSPNWASLLMGAGPEQHGVTSNDWQPDRHELPPVFAGPHGRFPTIFDLLREQRPGAVLAVFHDWDDLGRLIERTVLNICMDCEGPTNATRRAAACFQEYRPLLTFVHLDHVDGAGHKYGHGSAGYLRAVTVAYRLIGELLEAVRLSGAADRTLVLVTSDHGGKGKSHGGATLAEIEIPWLIAGPGVRAGHEIQSPVSICDAAPTIAFALGISPPPVWVGRPVQEAFARP